MARLVTQAAPFDGSPPLPDPPAVRGRVRHAPQQPFPAYRYVPGSGQPHPVNDPRGHSWRDVPAAPHPPWTPHLWLLLPSWLYGVDLYNHWYFWEAHEAWEELWQVADKARPPALLLQALIQCSAAMLKVHLRSLPGATGLWSGADARLRAVAAEHHELLGVRPARVHKDMKRFFAPLAHGRLPALAEGFPLLTLDT